MTGPRDGGRRLSRRKVLLGVATTGAAAAVGGGTAAFLTDTERFGSAVTAGTLDLETAWGTETAVGDDAAVVDDVPAIDLGAATTGDTGQFQVDLAVSGNPAYVWFRTKCSQGTAAEGAIDVRITLVTDEGETVLLPDSGSGYAPLEDVRAALGEGTRLDDELVPDDTWQVVIDWKVTESATEDDTVTFDFGFHAKQTHHVDDPAAVTPGWACDGGTGGGGSTGNGPTEHDISWVAFCARGNPDLEYGDDLEIRGSTLKYDLSGISDGITINAIVVKYGGPGGGTLEVFESFPTSGETTPGDGTRYDSTTGNAFETTDRSNPVPCPGECWYKYDDSPEKECDPQ